MAKNIVLVHGFWADSSSYSKIIPILQKSGYTETPAAAIVETPTKSVAWKTRPSWFVLASNDKTINPDLQRFETDRMKANVLELPTSHVPMISKPNEVSKFIIEATEAIG